MVEGVCVIFIARADSDRVQNTINQSPSVIGNYKNLMPRVYDKPGIDALSHRVVKTSVAILNFLEVLYGAVAVDKNGTFFWFC